MAKTVIGYFEPVSEAQRVLQDLLDHDFDRDQISFIAHQERSVLEAGGNWAPRAISVPGVGSVLATGPLAASLSSSTGGPSGTSLLEVLKDNNVPTAEAEWYLDAVRRGGVLVTVETGDADADRAVDLMNRVIEPAQGIRGRADAQTNVSRKGVDMETIERSIDLHVPVEAAYQQWTRFEEFPRFMEGVEEVRRLDAKRLHWVANIGGTRKEWDAQITEDVPNKRMAWRSEAGEFTAGVVTFQPLGPDRTRLTVRFDYEPHGVKETLGDWFGVIARRVEGDLERFQAFVEAHGQGAIGQRATAPTAGRTQSRTTSAATTAPSKRRFEDDEADFQQHYRNDLAGRGLAYEHYAPAYRYGYALAADPLYNGRDWSGMEMDVRRQWEERHQGNWEEARDAVHYAWEHVRGRQHAAVGDMRIPVVEEELQVGTRQVQRGGVRLYTRVTERPVEETVRLRDETVHVERHPVDRPASEADLARFKEGTIEVTETDEEAVVRKQARVVEEVVVKKDAQEQTETIRETVRRTEVEVEPLSSAKTTTGERGFEAYDADFRSHYKTSLASRGQAYERWSPGYRYGYELAGDQRYAGRDWTAIEPEARRDWEVRHQGTWEEFKDTVRYAWDTVRGRR